MEKASKYVKLILIKLLNNNNILYSFFRAVVHHPQRLQTVLELYSQDIKGLVLFSDTNNLDFYSGLAKGNFEVHIYKQTLSEIYVYICIILFL